MLCYGDITSDARYLGVTFISSEERDYKVRLAKKPH